METKPTREQAQLKLQLYEMRREARLRQARDWFFKNYFVSNLEDAMRIAAPGTENGTLAMMVLTYWEQACALLNYDLLHEDLFFETSGEFFGVWELAKPAVPEGRERFVNKQFLEPGKSCAALRNVDRSPLPGSHRRHAPVYEADARSGSKSGLGPDFGPAQKHASLRPPDAQPRF